MRSDRPKSERSADATSQRVAFCQLAASPAIDLSLLKQSFLFSIVLFLLIFLGPNRVSAQDDGFQIPSLAPPAAPGNVIYRGGSWDFEAVDVNKLVGQIRSFGFQLPIDLKGNVSGSISWRIPVNALADSSKYRLRGNIRSRQLQVEGVSLEAFEAQLLFVNQRLYLEELEFEVQDDETGERGVVAGKALLDLNKADNLFSEVELSNVPICALKPIVPELDGTVRGQLTGNVKTSAKVSTIRDVEAWQAAGRLRAVELSIVGRPELDIAGNVTLKQGVLRSSNAVGSAGENQASGIAKLTLLDDLKYEIELAGTIDDITQAPMWLGFEVPIELPAKLKTEGKLAGTLSPFTYEYSGEVTAKNTRLAGSELESLFAKIAIGNQAVSIVDGVIEIPGGQLTGTLFHQWDGTADSKLTLSADAFDLSKLIDLESLESLEQALVSGSLAFDVPAGKLDDWQDWQAVGNVAVSDILILDKAIDRIQLDLSQANRVAKFDFRATGLGGFVEGEFRNTWDEGPATGKLAIQSVAVEELTALFSVDAIQASGDLNGSFDFEVPWEEAADPNQWKLTGDGEIVDAVLLEEPLESVTLKVWTEPKNLLLQLNTKGWGGSLVAELTRKGTEQIEWAGQVNGSDVDLQPVLQRYLNSSVPVSGAVNINLEFTASEDELVDPRLWVLNALIKAENLNSGDLRVGDVELRLKQKDRQAQYDLDANLFDGALTSDGTLHWKDDRPEVSGNLAIQRVELQRVLSVWQNSLDQPPYQGELNAKVDFAYPASDSAQPSLTGELTLLNLVGHETIISDRIEAGIQLQNDRLAMDAIEGNVAGGRLRAEIDWLVNSQDTPRFQLTLRNARLGDIGDAFLDEPDDDLRGRVNLRLSGDIGMYSRAAGQAELTRIELAGAQIRSLTIPLRIQVDALGGRAEVNASNIVARMRRGSVLGNVNIKAHSRVDVRGGLTLRRVSLSDDVPFEALSEAGLGYVDGTIDFKGRRIKSLSEIDSTFSFDLSRSHAFDLPVLEDLQPFITAAPQSTVFQEGKIEGRSSRGTIYLEEVSMVNPQVQVYLDGTVGGNGRLRMNATVQTGNTNQTLALWLLRQIPKAAPPPIAILLSANDFLSNRTIHFEINGTTSHPIVRIRPLPLLSQEAVRFFLQNAAGL